MEGRTGTTSQLQRGCLGIGPRHFCNCLACLLLKVEKMISFLLDQSFQITGVYLVALRFFGIASRTEKSPFFFAQTVFELHSSLGIESAHGSTRVVQ